MSKRDSKTGYKIAVCVYSVNQVRSCLGHDPLREDIEGLAELVKEHSLKVEPDDFDYHPI